MKANYDQSPAALCNQNNGSWLYNYNIQTVTVDGKTSYECKQVIIWGEPTRKKIKQAIIESEYSDNEEKELINDYLAFQAGILTATKSRDNYLDFLNRRKAIKQMVNNDVLINVES